MAYENIAIIPARMGSKSIPNKNLQMLGGKSLLRIACEKAHEARIFNKIILTTDYPKNRLDFDPAELKITVVKRPPQLADDNSMMIDVIQHALQGMGNHKWVWLLQPTSPFRRIEDFKAISKLIDSYPVDAEINSLISFKPVHEHSNRIYTRKLINKEEGNQYTPYYRSQRMKYTNYENKENLIKEFIRSGAFYVAKQVPLLEQKTFDMKHTIAWLPTPEDRMNRILGCNIDNEEDYMMAKAWLSHGEVKV